MLKNAWCLLNTSWHRRQNRSRKVLAKAMFIIALVHYINVNASEPLMPCYMDDKQKNENKGIDSCEKHHLGKTPKSARQIL